jgi:hypothetical protein
VVWTGWRTGLAAKFKDFKKGVWIAAEIRYWRAKPLVPHPTWKKCYPDYCVTTIFCRCKYPIWGLLKFIWALSCSDQVVWTRFLKNKKKPPPRNNNVVSL